MQSKNCSVRREILDSSARRSQEEFNSLGHPKFSRSLLEKANPDEQSSSFHVYKTLCVALSKVESPVPKPSAM
jgi:hypothetical protein